MFNLNTVFQPHCMPSENIAVEEEDRVMIENVCSCVSAIDSVGQFKSATVKRKDNGYELIFVTKDEASFQISLHEMMTVYNSFPFRIQYMRITQQNGTMALRVFVSNSKQPIYFDEFQIQNVRKRRRWF